MPSSWSTSLRFELQFSGENINLWGSKLNSAIQRADEAIAGWRTIALTGAYALVTANDNTDEAHFGMLKFTGTGAFAVTIPSVSKRYDIWNACTGILTITLGAGLTAAIQAGEKVSVVTDGSSGVYRVQPTDFGSQRITNVGYPSASTDAASKQYADDLAFTANAGVLPAQTGNAGAYLTTNGTTASWTAFGSTAAQIWAASSITTAITPGRYKDSLAPAALTDAATITPDLTAAKRFTLAKSMNGALALPTHTFPGDIFEIYITQDATGSRTLTYATGYRRPAGAIPLTTTANARDKLIGVVEAVDGSGTATDVTYNLLRNLIA